MNNTKKLEEILSRSSSERFSATGLSKTTNGSLIISVVNSKAGHRISISKALASKLELEKTVQVAAMPQDGLLLIGKLLPRNNDNYCLSGNQGEKRLSYSTPLVNMITEAFTLDYSSRSSQSFGDITVEIMPVDGKDIPVAFVKIGSDNGQPDL